MALSSTKLKSFLQKLAGEVGEIQLKYLYKTHKIQVKKDAGIVTEADKASEKHILKNLFKHFPNSSVITEESGEFRRGEALCWIVDPLDGTSNYAHGFPWFCVSIGLFEDGKSRAGVVYNPVSKEMFFADRGHGSFLNGKRIHVSKTRQMDKALLGTGFYYCKGPALREQVEIFREMNEQVLAVRRPGAAALDLAYVACGRYEAFWERGLAPWDVAAGFVLIEEAGGKISDYFGRPASVFGREVIASNGVIHSKMQSIIAKSLKCA